jgi:homocysteine S-methyltransferase
MKRRDILARLAAGEHLLLDGATGSELQRRGVNVSQGIAPDGGLGAWSATAMGDAPEVVREIHEDYLRAGADIITTNSFWTNQFRLGMVGLAHKMEEYTRLAAQIAGTARDKLNSEAYVAGSLAPPDMPGLNLFHEYSEQATILAQAGVDLILLEYVSSIAESIQLVSAAAPTGLPVFLGICEIRPNGTMRFGEPIEQLVEALQQHRVDALLLMCSQPETISTVLPKLNQCFAGPIGCYAEVGYERAPQPPHFPEQQWHRIEAGAYPPARYAEFARAWVALGAQIVGGCCATTPEHIAAIRPIVKAGEVSKR